MSKEKTNSQNKKQTTKKKDIKTTKNEEKITKTKSKDTNKDIKELKKESKKVIKEDIIDEEDYIDDDLEDFEEEEVEIVKEKKIKPQKKEKEKKKEEISRESIKKIEKLAKEKSKVKKTKSKKGNNNFAKFGSFIEENRHIIYGFIVGVLITLFIAILIWPDRIATLKNGTEPIVKVSKTTYTADDLYKQMKDHYSVSQLLDKIDNDLLTKMYPETDEMLSEVKESAEYYINMYKQYYNYTEEQFLSANGFASYDAYLEYLKLENRRKKYTDQYIEDNLTDKEIEKYYNDNVYGDINCQHILVETKSDSNSDSKSKSDNKLSDEEGKKLAEEIIDKINDGKSWKDIQKEYKDKTTFEDLGYQSWDSDLEDSFKTALKEMDNKSYSKEPVKTSYGYHVIYRIDQKKAPSLKKVKSKIVDKLVEKKKSDDSDIQTKALINLRKDKKIKFYDTDLKKKYDNYVKQYKK